MSLTILDVFGQEGALANHIDGYQARHGQIELAEHVFEAISNNQSYVAEAPTGIGKTFAYLVPALLSGKKTVVSTGTKNLQDQLFNRDLPLLVKALKKPLKTALLKGRQNYICHYRLEHNLVNAWFPTKNIQKEFKLIHQNLARFDTGDRAEFSEISEDSETWAFTTSTADNCLSKDCPFIKDCFVVKARKKAQQADLVVINHHLFFADCALKEEGFGEILPNADVVIFDEAHQLGQVASNFFGKRLSSRQIKLLASELEQEQKNHDFDDAVLFEIQTKLVNKSNEIRETIELPNGRYSWLDVFKNNSLNTAFLNLKVALDELKTHLDAIKERSITYQSLTQKLSEFILFLNSVIDAKDSHNAIYWIELFNNSLIINETPLVLAKLFQSILLPKTSYIYTSATLSVNGNFDHFLNDLGINTAISEQFDSPFDYQEQTMMYLPRELPDPKEDTYIAKLVEQTLPIIEAFSGRTFFLFTSFKALHKAQEVFEEKSSFNLFVQGDMSKNQLVDVFCKTDRAVLLGTNSFWEGIDVRGQALSCVIVDKLPFESPFDPVVKARLDQLKHQGLMPFENYQLPHAVIALKQGLGRLIRDMNDKGVLIVGDPRLSGRAYGESFLKSLPSMVVTRERPLVLEFIKNLCLNNHHENNSDY